MNEKRIKEAIILSVGLVMSSVIFGLAHFHARSVAVQHIRVKGLSEREVDANIGIWTIHFESVGDDLDKINAHIKEQTDLLVAFLKQHGFSDQDIVYGVPALDDRGKYNDVKLRYALQMNLVLHSSNVSLVYETVQKSQKLMKLGVCLNRARWDGPAKFIFTHLNEIKPSMIQEATINAKKAAERLAADANLQLGPLRSAIQGTFSIEDTHMPTRKRVRIVTQVDYAIK